MQTLTCIVCPKGCKLSIEKEGQSYKISGNQCQRGTDYAINEITNPTRVITSTVVIKDAHYSRCPVKTDKPIPKERMLECMTVINNLIVTAPLTCGDVVVEDLFGLGVNIVVTRDMAKV